MVRGAGAPSKELVQAAARKATFTSKAWVELAEKLKSDGTLRDEVNKLDITRKDKEVFAGPNSLSPS